MATERRTSRGGGHPGGEGSEWRTLAQAASYLGVAQSTVRKWSDAGRLPAFYTPGGHRRFRRADLDSFLAGSSGGATATAGKQVVLIVDDDEQLREFVRVNLEMDGYLVREAGSAQAGLAALQDEPPDLVLLDVMMPEVDGFEMLRTMQERHGLGSVPVIMFSGKVDEETAGRAAQEGAQAFIGKPFDPQALIESTKQLLSRR
jgi:excisionase family DNA binding protein